VNRPLLNARLAGMGTTIFAEMSALAVTTGAVNLGQGFPDVDGPREIAEAAVAAIREGRGNQYPPGAGVPELRQAIAVHQKRFYGFDLDPDSQVLVTVGATEAIAAALLALLEPGDEAIAFEPYYDSYAASVAMAGATRVPVTLRPPDFRPDLDALRAAITPRTRVILLNSPHNPTGVVFTPDELARVAELACEHDLLVVSDEVYEHMVFDGRRHESCARHPALAARSVVVSSFGKTYHVTGWKVGYVLAPRELMAEFRKAHQFIVFTVNTPVQLALADYMADASLHLGLAAFYQRKRDLFRDGLAASRLRLLPCEGTYFQLASYAGLTEERDDALAERLTRESGVASIPVSAFYEDPPHDPVLRFCFAKNDDTLARACERLARARW
jgi:methionine transaminase